MKRGMTFACIVLLPLGFLWYYLPLRQSGDFRTSLSVGKGDEVLVGVAWPFAENQDGMKEGLLLAQEEINVRGVAGKHIRLEMEDDHLDRETSRSLAVKFAQDPRMAATIGYYDDKFAVRASAIFEESRLLHIVAGANNTYMTSHGFRYLIRAVPSNDQIGHKMARLAAGRGFHNIAIVAEDGPFGEDLAYQTSDGLDTMDARVVYHSSYVAEKAEFRDTVDEIKEVSPDAILFLGLERESALFIRTARRMGLQTPIIGTFSDTPVMHSIAGSALEGVMFCEFYDVNSPTPENQDFVARYRRRFGREPGPYAAEGYDSLRILAKAIEITGNTNPLDLAYAIRAMDKWEGANGPYEFSSTGELEDREIYLKMYKGGTPVVLARSKIVDAPAPPGSKNDLNPSEGK